MDIRAVIENIVWNYLWGMPLVLLLLGTGLYLTIKSGFFQFRFAKAVCKETKNQLFKKSSGKDGEGMISPYQAMSMALGTTIGVGNIGGVATAIAIGGPGAIFWMWMAGLFGMIIKMAEITLAVHYRSNGLGGETFGGPTYYMKKGVAKKKGFGKGYKVLTSVFSLG
ncbi:MAG: alanine:cation symporter family protein, partial [Peptostreptococcaceae bacterium]